MVNPLKKKASVYPDDKGYTSPDAIAQKIKNTILSYEDDITLRNQEIEEIDRVLYADGLFEGLEFPNGHDKTLYNWCSRVVDIHTSQLMGRLFQVYSSYNKEDISRATQNPPQPAQQPAAQPGTPQTGAPVDAQDPAEGPEPAQSEDELKLINKQRKVEADARQNLVKAIIKDNKLEAGFKRAARIGSSGGFTVFKEWYDKDAKRTHIVPLESIANYRAGWSSDDFRDRDWDAYVYQISPTTANRLYADKLPEGETFEKTLYGEPFNNQFSQTTTDSLNRDVAAAQRINRPMVTVVDFTGYLEGCTPTDEYKLAETTPGKEKKFSALIVGGHVVQVIKDENLMPDYYIIQNREKIRRPWGQADVNSSAIQINRSYIEAMSDWRTVSNKILFPLVKAKGFEVGTVPQKRQRKMTVVPMSVEQDLEALNLPGNFGPEYKSYIEELKENFVRIVGVGRVLFDDPSVNANSNQALITTLKGVIDIVEDKQARWDSVLPEMFKKALSKAAAFDKNVDALINTDDEWYFYVEWPSVLRKEDATYRQMLLNEWNAGVYSYDTMLEKLGVRDASEEIDRIRDNMEDPTLAAIVAHQLAEIASWTINKAKGIPPWGYVVPKVQLRGDLTPNQEGNMADNFGWNQGPFGASIGPQGASGQAANDNFINSGQIIDPTTGQPGNAYDGGVPAGAHPSSGQSPQAPTLTPDQNGGGTMQPQSQPGSGATAVSPQGGLNQANQRAGR